MLKTYDFKYFNLLSYNYNQILNVFNLKFGFIYYKKKVTLYKYNFNSLFLKRKKLYKIFQLFMKLYKLLSSGFFIELLLVGLGYKVAKVAKNKIRFDLNYSHKIIYRIPTNIIIRCFKKRVVIFGVDKRIVQNTAIEIRNLRIPNIYKGTGIRFKTENIKLKIGKKK